MVVLLRYLNLLLGLFSWQNPILSAIRIRLHLIDLRPSSLMSKTQQQLIICFLRDPIFLVLSVELWLFLLFLISVISHIVFHLMFFHLLNQVLLAHSAGSLGTLVMRYRSICLWEALLQLCIFSMCATVDQKLLLNLVTSHGCCESMANTFHF